MNKVRSRVSFSNRYFLILGGIAFTLIGLLFLTRYRSSLEWRIEQVRAAALDLWSGRAETVPTPAGAPVAEASRAAAPTVATTYEERVPSAPTATFSLTATPLPPTPDPLPARADLDGVRYERQDINNCGPATLAMMLSYWGWQGDQATIQQVLRPNRRDKNVRWDEMVYYVKNYAGWLDALFRAGGTMQGLKPFIANGYPVIIATGYAVKEGWVGHYLLLTGYDDAEETFFTQDSFGGPDRRVSYAEIDRNWQQFNRYFILVFPVDERERIMALLGADSNETANRRRALETAQAETKADPQNAFAWFNLGSNLNYFDRYAEAAEAFDRARQIGLPWRMMFYQFGPYRAYFNVGRYQDVIDVSSAALNARPDLEENFFWRGWARYLLNDRDGAIADFRSALEVNPNFEDAKTALQPLSAP